MSYPKLLKITCCMVILVSVAALSCKKSNSPKVVTANAIILNEGNVDADGCGWLVKTTGTNGVVYSPTNLAVAYQVDSLKVYITYQVLSEKYSCGGLPEPLNGGITEIKINTIKKAN